MLRAITLGVVLALLAGACAWMHHAGYESGLDKNATKLAVATLDRDAALDANRALAKTIVELQDKNTKLADALRVSASAEQDARARSQQQARRDAERLAAKLKSLRGAYDSEQSIRAWADMPVPDAVADRLRQ